MKRCPVEQGGCGELVEMLFDSGVCQKCDAMINRGTASVGGPPKRRGRNPEAELPPTEAQPEPCRKYVKGPERGICATCQATRAAHLAAKKNRVAPAAPKKRGPGRAPGNDDAMVIERLRSTWTEEYERCQREASAWLAKLEVLDEVENAMRA
jgi:hypothetical protein